MDIDMETRLTALCPSMPVWNEVSMKPMNQTSPQPAPCINTMLLLDLLSIQG